MGNLISNKTLSRVRLGRLSGRGTWRIEEVERLFHIFATIMSEFSQISRLQEENRKVRATFKHQRDEFFVDF